MPSSHTIPERVENRCEPCEYHKLTGSFCGKDHSWREYECTHPKALDGLHEHPEITAQLAEVFGWRRYIGKTEQQPPWCPLQKENVIN
jgi:hypothetical protein